ncbi:MAG: DUF167 domain-containing protein [Gemmatimonadota bacterium]
MRVEVGRGVVRFRVRVQPRASRTEIAGPYEDGVKVRLAAPPVEGAANEALLRFLSKRLRVPRSSVRIVRGGRSRDKLVEVTGVTPDAVNQGLQQERRQ